MIEFFSHLRLDSPRFIAATHFAEIISYKLLKSPAPQLYTMQINYDAHSDQKLTFLYRVVPGHSNCSYGCHCARLAEVKHSVVKRGEEISALMSIGEIILPLRDRVKGRFDNKVVLAIATAFESMKSPLELEILWKLLEQLE